MSDSTLTAEQYAHHYFNTPEARRADELEAKFRNAIPVCEVLASGHSEPSDVPIEVILGFKS